MTVEGGQITMSFPAGEDLSSVQYYYVKLSSGTLVKCTAVTDIPIGVLQNDPESGETGLVCVVGRTKISADAAISEGALIGPSQDGQAQTAVATQYSNGIALEEATGAGQIISAFVQLGTIVKA